MTRRKVFVIDDDVEVTLALSVRLGATGYRTMVANAGAEGLEKMPGFGPDVLLLDIRMPDMDGFEILRRMKENPQLCLIPVIFISANAQETVRRAALTAGARCFLEKPFDFSAPSKASLKSAHG